MSTLRLNWTELEEWQTSLGVCPLLWPRVCVCLKCKFGTLFVQSSQQSAPLWGTTDWTNTKCDQLFHWRARHLIQTWFHLSWMFAYQSRALFTVPALPDAKIFKQRHIFSHVCIIPMLVWIVWWATEDIWAPKCRAKYRCFKKWSNQPCLDVACSLDDYHSEILDLDSYTVYIRWRNR